jgi:hypothetical protein
MTLDTYGGYWSPIVWIFAFIVAFLISYVLWGLGERKYKKGEQVKPFISGVDEPSKAEIHVRGGNVYWGFTEALKGYYTLVRKMHTGILNDYVLWFIGVAAILFIIIFIPEVLL